jgi:hypothetical protein
LKSLSDDFVETRKDAEGLWRWEIKRRSRPQGITLFEGGFHTPAEAQLAGENFLKQLVDHTGRNRDQ